MSPDRESLPPGEPTTAELTDDVIPEANNDDAITENVVPEADEVYEHPLVPEPTHTDKTRRTLALGILGALLLVYLSVFAAFLLTNMPMEKFTAAIAGVSGLQALAAAAVGFYYGKGQHNHE